MTADTIAALRSEFAKLDYENTGVVTHEQFVRLLRSNGVAKEEADGIFEGMDQDCELHLW